MKLNRTKIAYHYTFIDKLLPRSFQTTAKISDFFQGWAIAHNAPLVPAPWHGYTVHGYGRRTSNPAIAFVITFVTE